jgi:hypothetical protein
MAKIWVESYDVIKHKNHMPEVCQKIDPQGQVIIIEAGQFRLEFLSLKQVEAAIAYFEKKDGGSTRLSAGGGDHWEFQSWQSRLPAGINNKHHRPKILSSLRFALEQYDEKSTYRAACT